MNNDHDLSIDDVEAIVRLVAEAGDPLDEADLPERKRRLAIGLCQLIDADVYMWNVTKLNPQDPTDLMAISVIDGGWESPAHQAMAIKLLTGARFASELGRTTAAAMARGKFCIFTTAEGMSPEAWRENRSAWNLTKLDQGLLCLYPVSADCLSGVGLHRKLGKPPFTEREKAIASMVLTQVEWLHRHATRAAPSASVFPLTTRERQTLLLVLFGYTKREIAAKLALSEHVIGDYTKSLYKHFNVNSRGELQSLFLLDHTSEDELESTSNSA